MKIEAISTLHVSMYLSINISFIRTGIVIFEFYITDNSTVKYSLKNLGFQGIKFKVYYRVLKFYGIK